jgi:hypothetical protein
MHSFQSIGSLAERIMSTQPRSVISQVHKDLRIPDGYYRTPVSTNSQWLPPMEIKTPPITEEQRHVAAAKLVAAKVISASSVDAVLARLCERLEKLPGYLNADGTRPIVPKDDCPPIPRDKFKSPRTIRMKAILLENPGLTIGKYCELGDCSKTIVYAAKQALRQEGKLP